MCQIPITKKLPLSKNVRLLSFLQLFNQQQLNTVNSTFFVSLTVCAASGKIPKKAKSGFIFQLPTLLFKSGTFTVSLWILRSSMSQSLSTLHKKKSVGTSVQRTNNRTSPVIRKAPHVSSDYHKKHFQQRAMPHHPYWTELKNWPKPTNSDAFRQFGCDDHTLLTWIRS